MRKNFMFLCATIAVLCWVMPAQSQAGFTGGLVVSTESTDLAVDSATDFDGTDDTFDQAAKDWDINSSRFGVRLNYDFGGSFSVFGELGQASATVRDRDVVDPAQDLGSAGFDEGMFFGLGGRYSSDASKSTFWSAGLLYSSFSTDVNEDVTTSFDYEQTTIAFDGRYGKNINNVGFYGGLRYVKYTACLDETDVTQLPGQQLRAVEFNRNDDFDVIVGMQSNGDKVNGFVQMGFLGTFSATAGLAFSF